MKFKHVLIAVIIAILMLAALPISSPASAHDEEPNLSVSEIVCTVGSEYVFTIPSKATITYPQLEADIGSLGIEDVFLPSGEWLSVSIVQGALEANGNPLEVLPYDVVFNPASVITAANIGETYPITIKIDATDYESAAFGVYEAPMLFEVVLQPYGEIVWMGTTNIEITKPQTGGGNDNQGDNDGQGDDDQDDIVAREDEEDQNNNQIQSGGEDQGIADERSDGANLDERTDNEASVTLGDEDVAGAGAQWFALWWWLFAIGSAIALLLILFFLMRRRKKDEEDTNRT